MSFQNGRKFFVHCLDGSGHINALIGFSQALLSRGHKVVVLVNMASQGQFSKYGLTEKILTRSTLKKKEATVNPVKVFAEMILKMDLLNGKTPLQKIQDYSEDHSFMINLYDSTVDFNPQIEQAIFEEKPDCFILDHFLVPPAVLKSKIPWIHLYSSNPLGLYNSPKLPPYGSGYHTGSDPSTWDEFFAAVNKTLREPFQHYQTKLYQHFNYTPTAHEATIERNIFFHKSPYLNLYGFPKELDYDDIVPIPPKTIRVDAFCRENSSFDTTFELPESFVKKPGNIIYLSMGSMGSIEINLMKRILRVIEKTKYKCIVSKGVRADEYSLPDNCWGEAFLPQTRILPLCQLVISHGGNNTVCESACFGKPIIVLPLFSDQIDNSQRIQEKGFGLRMEVNFEENALLNAIDKLINDDLLQEKLTNIAKRIKEDNSKAQACKEIERLLETEWIKK